VNTDFMPLFERSYRLTKEEAQAIAKSAVASGLAHFAVKSKVGTSHVRKEPRTSYIESPEKRAAALRSYHRRKKDPAIKNGWKKPEDHKQDEADPHIVSEPDRTFPLTR
jgi:hypothetical protein